MEATNTSDASDYWDTTPEVAAAPPSPSVQPEVDLAAIGWKMYHVTLPGIAFLGFLANVLSAATLTRRNFRHSSTALYLTTLAAADCCVLLKDVGDVTAHYVIGGQLESLTLGSDVGCRALKAFHFATMTWAAWMVVCVTSERCLVTLLPFSATKFCTVRVARAVVMAITAALFALWFGAIFGVGTSATGPCDLTPYRRFMRHGGSWLLMALYTYLPTTLLVTLNIVTGVQLIRSRRLHSNNRPGTVTSQDKTARMTTTILIVSLSYLLLTVPSAVIVLFSKWVEGPQGATPLLVLLERVAALLVAINHSLNFFIYVWRSTKFRAEFLALTHVDLV